MQKLDEFWNVKLYLFLNCIHHIYAINRVLNQSVHVAISGSE